MHFISSNFRHGASYALDHYRTVKRK